MVTKQRNGEGGVVKRWMSRRRVLGLVDAARVNDAIRKAEQGSTGKVGVSIAAPFWGDAHRTARRAFERLGMHRTPHRNAVLLFLVPSRRRFVILGDSAIHDKVGDAFWRRLSHVLCERFRTEDFTGGLVHGIEAVGEALRLHFSHQDAAVGKGARPVGDPR